MNRFSFRVSQHFCATGLIALTMLATQSRTAWAEETHTLRYQFQQDEVVRYLVEDSSKIDIEQGDGATSIKYETTSWKRYSVRKVNPDGSAVLELRIERVKMKASGEQGESEFDTAVPGETPEAYKHIRSTVGPPIAEITVSPSGKLLDSKPLLPQDQKSGSVDDRYMQVLTQLPEEPVAIGGVWKENFKIDVLIPPALTKTITLQRKHTLLKVEEGKATIVLDTAIITPLDDPTEQIQAIQRAPSGVLTVDIATGRMSHRRTTLNKSVVGASGEGSKVTVLRTLDEKMVESTTAATDTNEKTK